MRRTYLGTPGVADAEDIYEGDNWLGIVNAVGEGILCWETFLNAHPEGHEIGDCEHMTIRWGFRVPAMLAFNPMYSEWWYDYNVLDKIYDSLLTTDPYYCSDYMPYIAKDWYVGTYISGGQELLYVDFWLREDVYWSDCTLFTTADVKFSLEDAEVLLAAKGCPSPWFSQSTWPVKNVTVYDDFYCRVYLVEKSIWAWQTVGGSIMIPRHIWEPIIAAYECEDLQGWGPDLDPNMVGTGPYLFVEHVENSHILLVKNTKYFLYNSTNFYIPKTESPGRDMQSHVGVVNRRAVSDTYSVTLSYESSPGTWTTIGTKSGTVGPRAANGIMFEAELRAAGLLGQTGVHLKASTTDPVRGVPVQRSVITHVTLAGDIDSDNNVGLTDAITLSTTYALPARWYPAADINLDLSVGLKDAVLLAVRYAQSVP
jgi:hypothetical protein